MIALIGLGELMRLDEAIGILESEHAAVAAARGA